MAASGVAPAFAGDAQVRSGKNTSFSAWMELSTGGVLMFRASEAAAEALRTADVVGCSVGTPKSKKSTNTASLRLDLASQDSEGASKYVVTVGSEEEKERWLQSLGAYSALTEMECGLYSARLVAALAAVRASPPEPEPDPAQAPKAFKLMVKASVLVPSPRKIKITASSMMELEAAAAAALDLPTGTHFVLCFWDEEFEEFAAVAPGEFGSLPTVAKVQLDPKGSSEPVPTTAAAPQPKDLEPEPEPVPVPAQVSEEPGGLAASPSPRVRRPRREKARRGSVLRGVLELKMVLVGSAACGKSCLVSRLLRNTYAESHVPTIGMTPEKHQCTVLDKSVSLAIWDRGAAETYGAVVKAFWKKVCGVMFVFDITDRTSFDYIQSTCLPELLSQRDAAGCPVLLVGNKTDGPRVISVHEARALGEKLAHAALNVNEEEEVPVLRGAVPYLETCCADADGSQQQVQLAFETLAKRAYISAFPDDTGAAALYEAEVLRQVLRDGAGAEQLQSSEPVMAQQQRQLAVEEEVAVDEDEATTIILPSSLESDDGGMAAMLASLEEEAAVMEVEMESSRRRQRR